MPKPIIAVDIDDVLVNEAEFIIAYSNKHWGHSLSLSDYTEHWSELWQVEMEEVERRAKELHQPGIKSKYRLIEHAHKILSKLSREYELVILTSRRAAVKEESFEWVEQNFAGIFSQVRFTGFYDTLDKNRHMLTKGDVLVDMGATYLIDDQLKHCLGAAEAGINVVLFGEHKLPAETKLPSNVVRCANWQAVQEYFNGRSKQ